MCLALAGLSLTATVWVVVAAMVVQGIHHPLSRMLLRMYTAIEVAIYAMVAGTLITIPLVPFGWQAIVLASHGAWLGAISALSRTRCRGAHLVRLARRACASHRTHRRRSRDQPGGPHPRPVLPARYGGEHTTDERASRIPLSTFAIAFATASDRARHRGCLDANRHRVGASEWVRRCVPGCPQCDPLIDQLTGPERCTPPGTRGGHT